MMQAARKERKGMAAVRKMGRTTRSSKQQQQLQQPPKKLKDHRRLWQH